LQPRSQGIHSFPAGGEIVSMSSTFEFTIWVNS
jgi:hypothetical protein